MPASLISISINIFLAILEKNCELSATPLPIHSQSTIYTVHTIFTNESILCNVGIEVYSVKFIDLPNRFQQQIYMPILIEIATLQCMQEEQKEQ